jgi:hypothetical protein
MERRIDYNHSNLTRRSRNVGHVGNVHHIDSPQIAEKFRGKKRIESLWLAGDGILGLY